MIYDRWQRWISVNLMVRNSEPIGSVNQGESPKNNSKMVARQTFVSFSGTFCKSEDKNKVISPPKPQGTITLSDSRANHRSLEQENPSPKVNQIPRNSKPDVEVIQGESPKSLVFHPGWPPDNPNFKARLFSDSGRITEKFGVSPRVAPRQSQFQSKTFQ